MSIDELLNLRKTRSVELRALRIEQKITRKELSSLSGLHLATIYRIESGEIAWNIDSEIIYIQTLKKYGVINGSLHQPLL